MGDSLCFAGANFSAIRKDFFLAGDYNFCDFKEVGFKSGIITFSFFI